MHDTPPPDSPPNTPALALVAAVAANGVIGRDNAMPWHLPDDLRRFRRITTGHAIVMGRKTWEAIGRPLPDRESIVVTRQAGYVAAGASVATSLDDALHRATMPPPVCCIGGEEIFRLALPRAGVMHLTLLDAPFEGDVHFPPFDAAEWIETSRERHEPGAHGPFGYAFVTLVRRSA